MANKEVCTCRKCSFFKKNGTVSKMKMKMLKSKNRGESSTRESARTRRYRLNNKNFSRLKSKNSETSEKHQSSLLRTTYGIKFVTFFVFDLD